MSLKQAVAVASHFPRLIWDQPLGRANWQEDQDVMYHQIDLNESNSKKSTDPVIVKLDFFFFLSPRHLLCFCFFLSQETPFSKADTHVEDTFDICCYTPA